MPNESALYKKMYLRLFASYDEAVTLLKESLAMENPSVQKAVSCLISAMEACEDLYIDAGENEENC